MPGCRRCRRASSSTEPVLMNSACAGLIQENAAGFPLQNWASGPITPAAIVAKTHAGLPCGRTERFASVQAPVPFGGSPAVAQPENKGLEDTMTIPSFTMRQLLEAGVHFGHHTRRWNPKMQPYLFGVRNGVHVIDLEQTVPLLARALEAVRQTTASGGRVLFVGTKRQAQEPVAAAARRCGQYFVNHRWLGGMLTNFKTISLSIKRLRELDEKISNPVAGITKRELLELTRDRDKLERALGGIKEMGGLPDL